MRLMNPLVEAIARVPVRVQSKLLFAFLAIVFTLIIFGTVGLDILSGMNERNKELVSLQQKIVAYRNVQHDTTRQLYNVTSVLLAEEKPRLDHMLRQLNQFGYNLDRLQFVEKDEAKLMLTVRADYDRFIEIVTKAVELARSEQIGAARRYQRDNAKPLANRLERLTNQLVNMAEAGMLDRVEASRRAYSTSRTALLGLALGSVFLALLLGYTFSSSIVRPLAQIKKRLEGIAGGDFSHNVEVSNRDELGALAGDINSTSHRLDKMYQQIEDQKTELEDWNENLQQRVSEQVEEIGRIGRLRRFLSPQVADLIVSSGDERQLESHRSEITVVFCDLRNFTKFSTLAEPEDAMQVLNQFYTALGARLREFEATIEHFAGDGLMAFFNDPLPCEDHAERAVRMALLMQEDVGKLIEKWNKRGLNLGFGIGISTGYATLGHIGSDEQYHYAAIGSVANLASRFCDQAKSGQILIGENVYAEIDDKIEVISVGEHTLKGFPDPVSILQVLQLNERMKTRHHSDIMPPIN